MSNAENHDLKTFEPKDDLISFIVKISGKGILNEKTTLFKLTFLLFLFIFGFYYFKGLFVDKKKYNDFVDIIVNKLRELDYPLTADTLLKNKDRTIEYFVNNKWTKAEMTDYDWVIG